jgi:hypothetical protein
MFSRFELGAICGVRASRQAISEELCAHLMLHLSGRNHSHTLYIRIYIYIYEHIYIYIHIHIYAPTTRGVKLSRLQQATHAAIKPSSHTAIKPLSQPDTILPASQPRGLRLIFYRGRSFRLQAATSRRAPEPLSQ